MIKIKKKIILTLSLLLMLGSGFIIYCFTLLPSIPELENISFEEPTTLYSTNNSLIDSYGAIARFPVHYQEIPNQLIHAFIAIEDKNFLHHSGVELKSLLRAAFFLIKTGKKKQGGSTITMQVARNFYLTQKKTYFRKILEILLALKMEHALTKQEILYLYLNKIFFGNHAYGIKAAAKIYYGKSLNELTLAQNAMLAGLPKAPSAINPLKNEKKAIKRRTRVLKAMLREKYITQQQYLLANQAPITAKYHSLPSKHTTPYIHQLIQRELKQIFPHQPIPKGLRIHTTLNDTIQTAAKRALQIGILNYARNTTKHAINHIARPEDRLYMLKQYPTYESLFPAVITQITPSHLYLLTKNSLVIMIPLSTQYQNLRAGDIVYLYQQEKKYFISNLPKLQGAFISMQPSDGAIRAILGGFDQQLSTFNRTTQTKLQPGSTLKPFIYLAALAHGYTAASLINDAPLVYIKNTHELWRPHNHNKQFSGPITLRRALIESKNLVSIRLLEKIGITNVIKFLTKFGFKKEQLPNNLSLALGTAEISPLQLNTAYSILGNGGYEVKPYLIDKIINNQGKIIYKKQKVIKSIIDPRDSFIITDILKEVLKKGTGKSATILNRPDIAGKTGTTNNLFDNWFTGYTPSLATTIWIGFDTPQSTHRYASQTALPIWIAFMKQISPLLPVSTFSIPPDLINIKINPTTGLREQTNSNKSYFEYFKKENPPPIAKKNIPSINLSDLF